VNSAEKTPCFGQQFSDGCCLRFGEGITTMERTKMGNESENVQAFSNDGETTGLNKSIGMTAVIERSVQVILS
jgi:hypothetical protein